jgi:hypothetical protein
MRFAWLFALLLAGGALAAQTNAPRAARSVHLAWAAPEGVLWIQEARVIEPQDGSYFCVQGFRNGYFGIQQRRDAGDKIALFSVWDPGDQNDPRSVPEDRRVEVLFNAPDVEVQRFGGEGTGAQSLVKLDWRIGETYRFAVHAVPGDRKTTYTAFLWLNREKKWKRLASFRTHTSGEALTDLSSFVEDFRRDGKTPDLRRSAWFGNGWVKTKEGYWVTLTQAKFTADNNPLMNINAFAEGSGFVLETGGKVQNRTPLWSTLSRVPTPYLPPETDAPPAAVPPAPASGS